MGVSISEKYFETLKRYLKSLEHLRMKHTTPWVEDGLYVRRP
jgi:hypothetical protein